MSDAAKMGVLWRGDRAARDGAIAEDHRLRPVFDALAALNADAEPVVYAEEMEEEVREQLLRLDGVLVWVDPISGGRDRARLDALLRDVASAGVCVSAHPDVILKMGTKEVLFDTRGLGWGSDVALYRTAAEFEGEFAPRLASSGPRVLKQHRGNGGIGVWKVELVAGAGKDPTVRVQHARQRDSLTEDLALDAFIERCNEYFAGDGRLIDQPYQPRIRDGMVRCYMAGDSVAGFARQFAAPDQSNVLGIPAAKTMYGPGETSLRRLKESMETDWVPAMQRLLEIDTASLPAIWDADFLYGPKDSAGEDSYVLCEINVSCCSPLPAEAFGMLAEVAVGRVR
jgi:hypothetical protein